MKKLYFFAPAFILLLTISCSNGGGGNTISTDLTGLEGIWDYNYSYSGEVSGPDGSISVDENVTGFITISKNSVKDGDGKTLNWSYDGTTFTVSNSSSDISIDPNCGALYLTAHVEWNAPLTPGASHANFSGDLSLTIGTDSCGELAGVFDVTGEMIKR